MPKEGVGVLIMTHHLVGHPLTDQSPPIASDTYSIRQCPSSALADYWGRDDIFSEKKYAI